MSALGLAGSAAIAATGVGLSATSWAAKLGWSKLLLAVAALGAVTALPVGYYVWARKPTGPVGPPMGGVTTSARISLPQDNSSLSKAADKPTLETGPAQETTRVAAPRTETKTEPSVALSEELGALDSARSMLASGDASGALARLDNYNKAFPKGRLQLEAEVLRIDALMKSGQQDLAKKRAQTFLAKHPNSVLAPRVRGFL